MVIKAVCINCICNVLGLDEVLSIKVYCLVKEHNICTHKVDGPKAAMSDLVQVTEDILGVIFEEKVSQLGVLRHSFPRGGRHYGLDMS